MDENTEVAEDDGPDTLAGDEPELAEGDDTEQTAVGDESGAFGGTGVAAPRRPPSIDAAVALTLPLLVVMSLLWLTLNVAMQVIAPVSTSGDIQRIGWISASIAALAAIALLASVLRRLPSAARVLVSVASVVVGAGALTGYSVLARTFEAVPLLIAPPIIAIGLAVPAYRMSAPSFDESDPFEMAALSLSWGFGVISPFVLSPLVWWLSDKAGNAGMDAIGLYLLPFVGVVMWWTAVLGARLVKPRPDTEALPLRRFWLVATLSITGMCALSLGAAWLMR